MTFQAATVPTGVGATIREIPPAECPKGHQLRPPNVQVFFGIAPDGARRRGYRCWACEGIIWSQ